MMVQTVDPERALIAAGIMVITGIVIFLVRNRKMIRDKFSRGGGVT